MADPDPATTAIIRAAAEQLAWAGGIEERIDMLVKLRETFEAEARAAERQRIRRDLFAMPIARFGDPVLVDRQKVADLLDGDDGD